ncbi:alpha/beta fold hydrolase [Phycicoccus ginsengisoli]
MEVYSRLVQTRAPARPEAVTLVLHGGASRRQAMRVRPTQLSVLRMVPIAARLAHAGQDRLAVFRLLNSARGWDAHTTPLDDVRWALGQVRERYGADLPVGLVGHSLGGRAALLAAGAAQVRSVVALATWLHPDEPLPVAAGRDVLFVHGDHDRVARPAYARAAARRLSASARVGFVTVRDGKHAMLRRHRVFDGLAADWVRATLLGEAVGGTVARVRAGEPAVDV